MHPLITRPQSWRKIRLLAHGSVRRSLRALIGMDQGHSRTALDLVSFKYPENKGIALDRMLRQIEQQLD